jgi:hypothetical protein
VVEERVGRNGDQLNDDHRGTETHCGLDTLGDREEGAHPQEKRESEVLDEDGLDEELDVVAHHKASVR